MRRYAIAIALFIVYGCATTAPTPQVPSTEPLHGVASWYGEEFAGRTTANGEIFDPMLLTAAHRTLPFGTVVDVKNSKTGQTVRVRINDRGPFVGNRMIDLSFAAAQQIGLIDPGSGEVDVMIVKLGRGDREPPAPYTVTLNEPAEPKEKVKIASEEPPKVEFPLPTQTTATKTTATTTTTNDADFDVQVVEEHHGVETRRQVSPDGKTIQEVPVGAPDKAASTSVPPAARPSPAADAAPSPGGRGEKQAAPGPRPPVTAHRSPAQFVVQAGAFGVEANAKALQQKLAQLGVDAHIDHDQLYRVRIGPFATREEAIRARGGLESKGMSAIVMTDDR